MAWTLIRKWNDPQWSYCRNNLLWSYHPLTLNSATDHLWSYLSMLFFGLTHSKDSATSLSTSSSESITFLWNWCEVATILWTSSSETITFLCVKLLAGGWPCKDVGYFHTSPLPYEMLRDPPLLVPHRVRLRQMRTRTPPKRELIRSSLRWTRTRTKSLRWKSSRKGPRTTRGSSRP